MHKLSYRITSLAPLVISGGHGDMNMVSTGEYIPGTTVLGLLAGRFIKETGSGKPHEDEKFNHWFLAGGLTFGAACIASDPDAGRGKAYWPTPVSIRRDKHKDLVYDMLFHESEKDLETRAARRFCNLDGGGFKTMDVNTDLNFHHARDRQKGIPLEGRIFNYESINPGQRFEGEISGAPDDLLGLVKTLGRRWTAYAGRSRSVQYGAVKFEILDDAPAAVPAAPRTEIDKNGRLSLTLLSDAILYNDCGFPTADKETAQKYLGGVEIIKAFIKTRRVENFISVWRLKKPTEVCLSAGSSFLLEVTDRDAGDLSRLVENGLGERTHEGFGKCVLGWQTEKTMDAPPSGRASGKTGEPQEEKVKMPGNVGEMPKTTHEILTSLARREMEKRVALTAMKDQKRFRGRPPNALIGRLKTMSEQMTPGGFRQTLEKLRKSARDKLERCVSTRKSLLEFLKGKEISIDKLIKEKDWADLKELCDLLTPGPWEAEGFERRLHHIYFTAFFSIMRKQTGNGG